MSSRRETCCIALSDCSQRVGLAQAIQGTFLAAAAIPGAYNHLQTCAQWPWHAVTPPCAAEPRGRPPPKAHACACMHAACMPRAHRHTALQQPLSPAFGAAHVLASPATCIRICTGLPARSRMARFAVPARLHPALHGHHCVLRRGMHRRRAVAGSSPPSLRPVQVPAALRRARPVGRGPGATPPLHAAARACTRLPKAGW